MKRLIDGVTYNTETATLLARSNYEGDWNNWAAQGEGELYQTRGGAFFIVEKLEYIAPGPLDQFGNETVGAPPVTKMRFRKCSEDGARKWIIEGDVGNIQTSNGRKKSDGVEVFLNPFEEKVSEDETEGTIYARMPASLKRKIEESAKGDGISANSWAMRCFERCLSSKNENVREDIGYIWWLAADLMIADDKEFKLKDIQQIAEEIADIVEGNWKNLGFNENERFDQDLSDLSVSGLYTDRESQLLKR
jgi:hypothetical protein